MQKAKTLSRNLDYNNVDAAIFHGNSTVGYGICFRSISYWSLGIAQKGNFESFALCFIRNR